MKLFEKFGLSHELLISIDRMGITTPTQIQGLSIPSVMQGKDVIGESATGSGKTLVFGCGIIDRVLPKKGLQALILTPTRELAEQVKDNIKQLELFLNNNKKLKIQLQLTNKINNLEYYIFDLKKKSNHNSANSHIKEKIVNYQKSLRKIKQSYYHNLENFDIVSIADLLNMSKNEIYNHLNKIKNNLYLKLQDYF